MTEIDYSKMPIVAKIRELNDAFSSAHVVVGWIDGNGTAQTAYAHLQAKAATGEDQPSLKKPVSVALIARTLNFGREPGVTAEGHKYGKIPPRPFMKFAEEIWNKEFPKILKKYVSLVLSGSMTIDGLFTAIGERARNAVQKAIREGKYQPLSPKTIARKGSSTPLIDTGRMVNSVTFEIRRG